MFIAVSTRTMANAKPKIVEAPKPVNLVEVMKERQRQIARYKYEAFQAQCRRVDEERVRVRQQMDAANRAAARFRQEWEIPQPKTQRRKVSNPTPLSIIIRRISRATGVTVAQMSGPRGNVKVSYALQAVMYWAARRSDLSAVEIGKALGNRDHSTIIHGKQAYVKKRAAQGRMLREAR